MRRLVVLCTLLALAVPVAAGASTRAVGDGTLAVRDLDGVPVGISVSIRVNTQATTGLIGRCDQCAFRLDDLRPNDDSDPLVTGAERARDVDGDGEDEFFSGRDVRWKIVGGGYWLKIRQGRDIDLSLVGRARVRLRGTTGTYVVNDGAEKLVPPDFAIFWLGTPPATP